MQIHKLNNRLRNIGNLLSLAADSAKEPFGGLELAGAFESPQFRKPICQVGIANENPLVILIRAI